MNAQPDGKTRAAGALTHLDEQGRARMVDVTAKPLTRRLAVARCAVITKVDAVEALGDTRHGIDPVEAARVAGIQAAKQTSSLVPLCHSIRVDRVSVDVDMSPHRIEITAVTEIVERTGVEMEALTACAVAGLTLVCSLLELDPDVSMEELTLWHKSGGRSGDWQRSARRPSSTGKQLRPRSPPIQLDIDPPQQLNLVNALICGINRPEFVVNARSLCYRVGMLPRLPADVRCRASAMDHRRSRSVARSLRGRALGPVVRRRLRRPRARSTCCPPDRCRT